MDKLNELNRINLVLIYGPPGIGKSTFKENLNNYIISQSNLKQHIICLFISYDDILDKNIESFLINQNDDSHVYDLVNATHKPNWKQARLYIAKLISNFIDYLNNKASFNLESSSTNIYLDKINKNFLKCITNQLENNLNNDKSKYIILLDDLFYYESMRLTFYRLALTKSCGYFSYYMKAHNLTLLLERNKSRNLEQQLNESIVENIYSKIESPKEWEKEFSHFELITSETNIDLFNTFEIILTGLINFKLYFEKINQTQTFASFQSPDVNRNLIHESDLKLRKLIGLKLSISNEKVLLAKKLNQFKTDLLNELRSGKSELSVRLYNLFELNEKLKIEDELKSKLDSI